MIRRPPTIPFPEGIHLTEFIDEVLPSELHARLAQSIDANPALQHQVDGLRNTIAVLNHLPSQKAPPELYDAVLSSTRRRFRPSWIRHLLSTLRLPVEAGFNVALMALLVVLYLHTLPSVDLEVKPMVTASVTQPQH
jgi:hypothetical protein